MAATPSYTLRGPVGIVIAHPDDESMFFAPALTALERDGERAVVLSLSSGRLRNDCSARWAVFIWPRTLL